MNKYNKEAYNAYQREYQLRRYHKRRSLAVEKLGGKCVVCNSTEELETDHINPKTKSFDIAILWSCSTEKFWKEIDKCQLLCKTHHLEKTSAEQSVAHGKGLTGKKNCRCDLCGPLKKLTYATY